MQFERILVRATNWIGDAVMSIPALAALREANPESHIAILAKPWVAGLYGREAFCDEVIAYQPPTGWRGLSWRRQLTRQLAARHFDCAILLQNAFEAAAIVRAAGIRVRIGYDRDARGWLLSHAVGPPAKGEIPPHQRFYYLELLKRAGIIDGYDLDKPIRLTGAAAAAREGRRLFAEAGIIGRVVGVSPGAAYGGAKRWLPDRFAEAASTVGRGMGATVAVFGSPQEAAVCHRIAEAVQVPCVDFAGRTPLARFIEMAAACDTFLTNDSGPMHIASALGVPTVSIFGATDHSATGPTGDNSRIVREAVDCSPCLLRECPIDHRCMTRVEARQVAAAALELVRITAGK